MTESVARELGLEFELEKITDLTRITQYGVMATPGLVVDGKVRLSGRVPSAAELRTLLQ
jgi:small redox-active disulfide protein 2